ncbi:MAG: hypothetical protein FWG77_10895 [Treponema sp.]|nr:hypothetical protein [Treponema sp.]
MYLYKEQNIPFNFVNKYPFDKLLNVLKKEPPETIAIILSFINSNTAAAILDAFSIDEQSEVIKYIAGIDKIPSEIVKKTEKEIEEKLTESLYTVSNGVELASSLLNKVSSRTAGLIIDKLKSEIPELAGKIDLNVFSFKDIVHLNDRHIQKVLREADILDLAKALRFSNIEFQDKLFKNMSRRAVSMLKEDMEFMGEINLADAEHAQEKIIRIIRKLEDTGEITVSKEFTV